MFADSGYRGAEKRQEIQDRHADVDWQIAMMPGKRKALNTTRYRGLAKNTSQLLVMFALSNLWMVRKRILQGAQA